MPCPHIKITIAKRSENKSAVAGAAYQSGERLFSEYDRKVKDYTGKKEVVHSDILLPPNAPEEYRDRAALWNAVEKVENQWNSQLARRMVIAIPKEIPPDQHARLIREYCQEQFVSKGMCADFAIHDKGDGNPHAHVMLTMRAIGEDGKWLPKSRKVYDLDENGQRIKLPSGSWKSHKEYTVDWNDRKYAEIWRHEWEVSANKYLEANNRPERLDMRSYARQGIDRIPTVHLGPEAAGLERKGIRTNKGNLNREINRTNRLKAALKKTIRSLIDWLTDVKDALREALREEEQEKTLPEYLLDYMSKRKAERMDWSIAAQNKCGLTDLRKISHAISFLKGKNIATVDELGAEIEHVTNELSRISQEQKRMEALRRLIRHSENYEKYKPIDEKYRSIHWKGQKEKFREKHRDELDAFYAADKFLRSHLDGRNHSRSEWRKELAGLEEVSKSHDKTTEQCRSDLNELKSVRYCVSCVMADDKSREQKQNNELNKQHEYER